LHAWQFDGAAHQGITVNYFHEFRDRLVGLVHFLPLGGGATGRIGGAHVGERFTSNTLKRMSKKSANDSFLAFSKNNLALALSQSLGAKPWIRSPGKFDSGILMYEDISMRRNSKKHVCRE
jgi:hypothetical protein